MTAPSPWFEDPPTQPIPPVPKTPDERLPRWLQDLNLVTPRNMVTALLLGVIATSSFAVAIDGPTFDTLSGSSKHVSPPKPLPEGCYEMGPKNFQCFDFETAVVHIYKSKDDIPGY